MSMSAWIWFLNPQLQFNTVQSHTGTLTQQTLCAKLAPLGETFLSLTELTSEETILKECYSLKNILLLVPEKHSYQIRGLLKNRNVRQLWLHCMNARERCILRPYVNEYDSKIIALLEFPQIDHCASWINKIKDKKSILIFLLKN